VILLHRDGTVAHVHVGYDADVLDSLVAEINALRAEPAAPPAVASIHCSPQHREGVIAGIPGLRANRTEVNLAAGRSAG
jgi:hypothetical protein